MVCVSLRLTAVPEILVVDIAALADTFALVIFPFTSLTIALKSPLNCAAVGIVPSTKVVGSEIKPVVVYPL